jgi:phage recombination protein Bet
MNNALITSNGFALDFTQREVLNTIKATVAKDLTDAELALFIEHCKGTRLNPYKKEVWAIKAGGRLQVMTGIAGFLAIANNHPMFDGMEVEVDNDEKPTKATCRVYRKDRKFPAVGVALLKEYGKDTPIWRQMPRVMLTKVAKSIAIREAFPMELNGIYTEEEMPTNFAAPVEVKTEVTVVDTSYCYNLSLIDHHKHEAAIELLKQEGGRLLFGLIWSSSKPIQKLARAAMSEEEITKFVEHLQEIGDQIEPIEPDRDDPRTI